MSVGAGFTRSHSEDINIGDYVKVVWLIPQSPHEINLIGHVVYKPSPTHGFRNPWVIIDETGASYTLDTTSPSYIIKYPQGENHVES